MFKYTPITTSEATSRHETHTYNKQQHTLEDTFWVIAFVKDITVNSCCDIRCKASDTHRHRPN